MELSVYFKSLLEQDENPIVICNLKHEMIYMNPAAIRNYAKRGGKGLLGKNLFLCHTEESQEQIKKVIAWFENSKENNKVYISFNRKKNKDIYMIALRDEEGTLIGYYEKHECRNAETERFYHFEK